MKKRIIYYLFWAASLISIFFLLEALHVSMRDVEEVKAQYRFEQLERIRNGAWHYRTHQLYVQSIVVGSILYGVLAWIFFDTYRKNPQNH